MSKLKIIDINEDALLKIIEKIFLAYPLYDIKTPKDFLLALSIVENFIEPMQYSDINFFQSWSVYIKKAKNVNTKSIINKIQDDWLSKHDIGIDHPLYKKIQEKRLKFLR